MFRARPMAPPITDDITVIIPIEKSQRPFFMLQVIASAIAAPIIVCWATILRLAREPNCPVPKAEERIKAR